MNFVQDPRCNSVIGAPPGVPIEQCRALPILRAQYEDGTPVIQSFWKPTEQELADLQAGKPLILTIWGHGMPPVSLGVEYESS